VGPLQKNVHEIFLFAGSNYFFIQMLTKSEQAYTDEGLIQTNGNCIVKITIFSHFFHTMIF